MARKVRTILEVTDDFDHKLIPEGEGENLVFVWRGNEYEIDVSNEHSEQLDLLMQPVIQHARRVRRVPTLAAKKKPKVIEGKSDSPAARRELPAGNAGADSEPIVMSDKQKMLSEREFRREVRAWARGNGFPDLGENGRLPLAVREAWDSAHPDRIIPPEREWGKTGHRPEMANA